MCRIHFNHHTKLPTVQPHASGIRTASKWAQPQPPPPCRNGALQLPNTRRREKDCGIFPFSDPHSIIPRPKIWTLPSKVPVVEERCQGRRLGFGWAAPLQALTPPSPPHSSLLLTACFQGDWRGRQGLPLTSRKVPHRLAGKEWARRLRAGNPTIRQQVSKLRRQNRPGRFWQLSDLRAMWGGDSSSLS